MSYLVDTNVLSELVRQRVDPHVADWVSKTAAPALSVLTEFAIGPTQLRRMNKFWPENAISRRNILYGGQASRCMVVGES